MQQTILCFAPLRKGGPLAGGRVVREPFGDNEKGTERLAVPAPLSEGIAAPDGRRRKSLLLKHWGFALDPSPARGGRGMTGFGFFRSLFRRYLIKSRDVTEGRG